MIQNTLFYKYINEREGKRIIEDERGFIIYQVNGDECFIVEGFVDEESRGSSAASDLLRHLFAEAKAEGCKFVTGNIWVNAKGSMRCLAAALKRGFKVQAANNDALFVIKEI